MKLNIEAESQAEFDAKRYDIIKAVAGSVYDVSVKKKGEKSANEPREPFYKSQGEMLEHWDGKFRDVLETIKFEIGNIIDEK